MRAVHGLGKQQAQASPQNALTSANNTFSSVEQFHRLKPPFFCHKIDHFTVEEWLKGLELVFKHIECKKWLEELELIYVD